MSVIKFALPTLALVSLTFSAQAQDPNYKPDILNLDGQTSYVFPTDGHLSIWGGGTIEFWLAPDWEEIPSYSPIVLSNRGSGGVLYEVSMRADKKGLILTSHDKIAPIDYDFSDGQMSHVALVNTDEEIVAMINGEIITVSSLKMANLEPNLLTLGSGKDGTLAFYGAIAALRIWDAAIEPETLIEYSWQDSISDTSDHPYLENLVGFSEFETQEFTIIDKPVMPTWLLSEDIIQITPEGGNNE